MIFFFSSGEIFERKRGVMEKTISFNLYPCKEYKRRLHDVSSWCGGVVDLVLIMHDRFWLQPNGKARDK
jgi:hypothetical protein